MPTEHEFKFVLRKEFLSSVDFAILSSGKVIPIEQGYLASAPGMTLRVRKTSKEWILTLKQKVNGRVVEIEQRVNRRDGIDLMSVTTNRLRKKRHVVHIGKYTWEVDVFFDDHDERYFVLAEVECKEGESRPAVPSLLAPHILYEVPLTDGRFSNKHLGNVEYAKSLYNELLSGKESSNGKDCHSEESEKGL